MLKTFKRTGAKASPHMLSHEWQELEALCDRITELQKNERAACQSHNAGLIAILNGQISSAERHHEHLLRHISTCLESVAY
jgi:hypothetical protein